MTSEKEPVVYAYLPGATESVPVGVLKMTEDGSEVLGSSFVYGRRYLDRGNAIEVDPVSLGFKAGQQVRDVELFPLNGLVEFGGIRDAAPDQWGRRVIENLRKAAPNTLSESEYLLSAGNNRVGALDIRAGFHAEPNRFVPNVQRLEYLLHAADAIDSGQAVPVGLHEIFAAGSSMGGMRPKAVIVDEEGRQWLAKFPSTGDNSFNVPAIEYATMKLAELCGLDVPGLRLIDVGQKRTVLLVERFDRVGRKDQTTRKHFVTALTLLGLHESQTANASYGEVALALAKHGAAGTIYAQQAELFARMIFNIFVTNNDDHLRNHGVLWEGAGWKLSPLYDVVPHVEIGTERSLVLSLGEQGRSANVSNAMSKYAQFGLDRNAALAVIDRIWRVVREWKSRFEEFGVAGKDIELVAGAFRHIDDVGGKEISRSDKPMNNQ
jgi:serine/threonine-protein kinase HipA